MSTTGLTEEQLRMLRIRDRGLLAPKLNAQVTDFKRMMEARGHDVLIFETLRLPQLQAEYFRRKTSRQRDVLRSMHGHGLAFDAISISRGWNFTDKWKEDVRDICAALGLTCGGLWKSPVDWPHIQWGALPGAVPDSLVVAYNTGGIYASWEAAGAV